MANNEQKAVMSKSDLAEELTKTARLSLKDANAVIEKVFAAIAEGLLDPECDGVKIPGFGTFSVVTRQGHTGVNPANHNEKIEIASTRTVKFKPSKTIKDLLK